MYDISKFHIYSVCVVATNKPEDGMDIECFPIEDMTHVSGDIDETEEIVVENTDIDNKNSSIVLSKRIYYIDGLRK